MAKKKTVLVTGASGFIGREVCRQLLDAGYSVIGLGYRDQPPNFKGKFSYIQQDLRDSESQFFFKNASVCIHLAAQIGGVKYMEAYPATILDDNLKILSNTFQAAVKHSYERLIYASSSMVFQHTSTHPSIEEHIYQTPTPTNIYGFSKLVGEYYCRSFRKEFGLDYTILRIFNAYGKGDYYDERGQVIPHLILKILSGQYPLELMGDPKASRPFTHVKDVARAFVLALESPKAVNEDFNIGSPNEIKIADLAKLIWEISDQKKPFKLHWSNQITDTSVRRSVNPVKGKKIGWEPQIDLQTGVREVVTWLKEETSKEKENVLEKNLKKARA